MTRIIFYTTIFFVTIIFSQHTVYSERRCRCLSDNPSCWPTNTLWQTFNASVDGRLISPKPSAAPCNSHPPNVNACAIATQRWHDSFWRGDQSGAMQNPNWENSSCSIYYNSSTCNQGSVPILAVNATSPEHVQTTLQFVNTHNLRLVIKNTGHDYLGRSTAYGSFLLWTHYMKDKTLVDKFTTCDGEVVSNAIRLEAGVQWGEAYQWLHEYNLTVIGGASGTVGAVGGFLQGGGHGPLTRWKGLAADQVLEYDVVLADGRRERVNACENRDLFWALRGGGAGTFAVVISATVRTYPSPTIVATFQMLNAPNDTRYTSFMRHFTQLLPTLAEVGWSGYFYFTINKILFLFFMPNGDINIANATMNQLYNNYSDLNVSRSPVFPLPSFYDLYAKVLEPSNPTGDNILMGSRLIPEEIIRTQPDRVADAFFQARGGNDSFLIGHLVAGGQVTNNTRNSSISPAWRTSLLHVVYAQGWDDGASAEEQQKLAKHVAQKVDILQTIAGGSQSASYMNEADANEPEWQQKFFGTVDIYNRLKAVKNAVDPNGIFVCKNCVGSDDWSEDLNCRKD